MAVNKNYFVSEGNIIGGQEPQALGTTQNLVKASVAVTKGMVIEATGNWTVGPASDGSVKVVGIALNDADVDEKVSFHSEGFVKLTASNATVTAGDKIIAAGDGLVRKFATATDKPEGVIGIAVAGCSANGNPYVKFSI